MKHNFQRLTLQPNSKRATLGVSAIMAAVLALGNAQASSVFELGTIVIRGDAETNALLVVPIP